MPFCNRGSSHRQHLMASLALGMSLLGVASSTRAAEPLPKLQVDPALLGMEASPAAAKPAETAAGALATTAPASAAAPAATPTVTPRVVAATPSTPPPRAAAVAAPSRKEAVNKEVAKVAANPVATTVATAKSLPPLLVDPALLGGSRKADEATLLAAPSSALREPPVVAAQPDLTPTYSAHVAAGVLPAPSLKTTSRLVAHATEPDDLLPTFLTADNMTGHTDDKMIAEGNVELRRRGAVLKSDRLTHWQATDEVEAEGNVDLTNEGDRIRGPKLRMKMADNTGFFEQPEYQIRRPQTGTPPILWTAGEEPTGQLTTGQGVASRMDFEGKGKYRLTDATYSTCTPAAGADPDWFARTSSLRLDYSEQEGVANNATLFFKGVPLLYSPWLSFSLNNERKSGLLTPTIGSTTRGGLEYTQPFYWNIAPNRDATIAPRVIAKRGVMWNGEYRYLEPNYSGTLLGQLLPNDRLEDKRRSAYSVTHNQYLGYGVSASLNLNGASDGTYFSDLANNSAIIAQTNLLRQGTLSYGASWWSASVLAQSYQTLQDPALPTVVTPYKRLPQINVNANRSDLPLGMSFAFTGENVNFSHPTLTEGRRFTLYPQISWPLQTAAFFITPKIGVHSTRYRLDKQALGVPDHITRSVPIASVDSGVTFERPLDWFGVSLTQTLEPRLYYLYIPERDQSQIPVFDSAVSDFNFAQIFSENRYVGGDRINDANQLTGMLTSRLLDPDNGAEILRASFGQRLYFTTQHVGLPGEVLRSDRQTDLLGAFSGRVLPKTYLDAGVQYNTRLGQMERFNISGRYQPEPGKLLNTGYRYTRDQLGQFDISGQWPIGGGWHGVGRYNYSTREKRLVESVAGLEYDGGCWVGRVVVQRLATQTQRVNSSLFFQLELNGFARLGSNPLELLKRAVPGYGVINRNTDSVEDSFAP